MVPCLITSCGFWSATDSVRDGGAYHRELHLSGTDCSDLPGGAIVGRSVSLAHYSAGASPHLASGLTACGAEGREPSGNPPRTAPAISCLGASRTPANTMRNSTAATRRPRNLHKSTRSLWRSATWRRCRNRIACLIRCAAGKRTRACGRVHGIATSDRQRVTRVHSRARCYACEVRCRPNLHSSSYAS